MREIANSGRINRARFIGNMIGVLLILVLLEQAVVFMASQVGANPALVAIITSPTGAAIHLPSAGVTIFFVALLLVFLLDLGIRRRHDRDRTGVDVIVWVEIAVGALVLFLFGPPNPGPAPFSPEQAIFIALVVGLGLRLLAALLLMPGTRGPNRYGEDPRDMLRRAGH
jgi:uncharacterized membrane protein YhaH (DUF805 family)